VGRIFYNERMEHPETTIINKHFAEKTWGSNVDDDTEFSFRAMVYHTAPNGCGKTVLYITFFPPTQYKTVEDKASFNRALNEYLPHLDWTAVEVTQGGKAAFSFNKFGDTKTA
jgi:hypothetical protein